MAKSLVLAYTINGQNFGAASFFRHPYGELLRLLQRQEELVDAARIATIGAGNDRQVARLCDIQYPVLHNTSLFVQKTSLIVSIEANSSFILFQGL